MPQMTTRRIGAEVAQRYAKSKVMQRENQRWSGSFRASPYFENDLISRKPACPQ